MMLSVLHPSSSGHLSPDVAWSDCPTARSLHLEGFALFNWAEPHSSSYSFVV